MRDATIIVKTFERPQCLERLLASIVGAHWQGPVLIGDDSRRPYRDPILARYGGMVTEYLCMPFDIGSSAGRNLLLKKVATPYFVLCDDDFIFDARTDVNRLRELVETAGLDLVGGVYFDRMAPSWRQAAAAAARLDWWHLCLRLGIEVPRKTFFNFAPCGVNQWRLTDIPYTPPGGSLRLCEQLLPGADAPPDRDRGRMGGIIENGRASGFFLQGKKSRAPHRAHGRSWRAAPDGTAAVIQQVSRSGIRDASEDVRECNHGTTPAADPRAMEANLQTADYRREGTPSGQRRRITAALTHAFPISTDSKGLVMDKGYILPRPPGQGARRRGVVLNEERE